MMLANQCWWKTDTKTMMKRTSEKVY